MFQYTYIQPTDIPDILNTAIEFNIESQCGVPVDPNSLVDYIVKTLEHKVGNVIIARQKDDLKFAGTLMVVTDSMWWDKNYKIASEVFWWVAPEFRGSSCGSDMLIIGESLARELGAQEFHMFCLESVNPDRVASLLERSGYVQAQRMFRKRF